MKSHNEYQRMIPLYDEIPKAVFAAIAYSMCFIVMEENSTAALARLFEEWLALHSNGIVPQKPPTRFKVAAALAKRLTTFPAPRAPLEPRAGEMPMRAAGKPPGPPGLVP